MEAIRQIYESGPELISIAIPPELQRRRLEVIILPLEETDALKSKLTNEEVVKLFGSLPDFPDRAPQGEYETRLDLP
jgi:hypothetical protein